MKIAETHQIGATLFFLLETSNFKGMVGEDIEYHTLCLLDTERMTKDVIDWKTAKRIYNKFCKDDASKKEKIACWCLIREISPKRIAERDREELMDAISRVI